MSSSRRALASVLLLLLAAVDGAAQSTANAFQPSRCVSDTTSASRTPVSVTTADTVAPGISYRCLYVREGPWAIHVVSIDLAGRRYAVEGARAQGAMLGRERVSDMVQRLRARTDTPLVAINADFFNLRTGEVENNTVIRGDWVKGVVISDSPHDELSLGELADQLIALGAYQAMNLDGGGSSTLWVRGTIVNHPSDPTGERPVGNALVIVPLKPRTGD